MLCNSSCLAPALAVTKFTNAEAMIFGHTLLCYLSQTLMLNKPASELRLNKNSTLVIALGVTKFTKILDMNLVTLCGAA